VKARTKHRFFVPARLLLAGLLTVGIAGLLPSESSAQAQTDTSRWMGQLADQYAVGPSPMDQTLEEFIFPGSHDAGTYKFKIAFGCDACAGPLEPIKSVPALSSLFTLLVEPWAAAQGQNLYEQLHSGSRAFDLRFFLANAGDVSASVAFANDVLTLFPNAGDTYDLTPIVDGSYYIHHTFAGPHSEDIFNDIKAYLLEDLHDQEVIILRFAFMNTGSKEDLPFKGNMSPTQLRDFFRHMFATLAPEIDDKYFVQYSGPGDAQQSLDSIINSETRPKQQIIITLNGDTPDWESGHVVDDEIKSLIWPEFARAYSGTYSTIDHDSNIDTPKVYDPVHSVVDSDGGYASAADWNTEGKLLDFMKRISAQRDVRTRPGVPGIDSFETDMFIAFAQFGPDDARFQITPPLVDPIDIPAPGMLARRIICN